MNPATWAGGPPERRCEWKQEVLLLETEQLRPTSESEYAAADGGWVRAGIVEGQGGVVLDGEPLRALQTSPLVTADLDGSPEPVQAIVRAPTRLEPGQPLAPGLPVVLRAFIPVAVHGGCP